MRLLIESVLNGSEAEEIKGIKKEIQEVWEEYGRYQIQML